MTTRVHKNDFLDDILINATNAINKNSEKWLDGEIDTDFFPFYLIFRDLRILKPQDTKLKRINEGLAHTQFTAFCGAGVVLAGTVGLVHHFHNIQNLLTTSTLMELAMVVGEWFFSKNLVIAMTGCKPADLTNPGHKFAYDLAAEVWQKAQDVKAHGTSIRSHMKVVEKHREEIEQLIEKLDIRPEDQMPEVYIIDNELPNAMCFGRGVGERGAIAFTTGMIRMMTQDPSIPSQFWITRDDAATVVGHEYGHFLRKHVTVNTLMMIGTMALSSVMDGVAQVAADWAEPLHVFLKSHFPALKNIIDMIWDRALGQAFYGMLSQLTQLVQLFVVRGCETAADFMSALITGNECGLGIVLTTMTGYIKWLMAQSQPSNSFAFNSQAFAHRRERLVDRRQTEAKKLIKSLNKTALVREEERRSVELEIARLLSDPTEQEVMNELTPKERLNLYVPRNMALYKGIRFAAFLDPTEKRAGNLVGTLFALGALAGFHMLTPLTAILAIAVVAMFDKPQDSVVGAKDTGKQAPGGPLADVIRFLEGVAKFLKLDKFYHLFQAGGHWVNSIWTALHYSHPMLFKRVKNMEYIHGSSCNIQAPSLNVA